MRITIDWHPLGTISGRCPYCDVEGVLTKHHLLPRWLGAAIVFPSAHVLVCPACHKPSRQESILDRILSALFLVPFLLLLVAGVVTGLFIGTQMMRAGAFSLGYSIIALILVVVGTYAALRAARTVARLLRTRRLLPMSGIWTSL